MAQIAPFGAIRYDRRRLGSDLSAVIAPPYDVLDHGDKEFLLARSDCNIVAIDLPHVPPQSSGPPEVYERAANTLNRWLAEGTLVQDPTPALYLYHQCFEHAGRRYTRRMFIARVRLVRFSEGSVLPHERTFGGPKEDRLALMKATEAQLSPVFGIFVDPEDSAGGALAATAAKAPCATGQLDGVENRLWVVTDAATIDSVVFAMRDRTVYIADGHHRYGTALLYRDELAKRHAGGLPADHPANWVMFVMASMDDPGCLILPYHRVLKRIDTGALLRAWAEGVERCAGDAADVVLLEAGTATETPVRFTNRGVLKCLAPEECDAWRRLDYAYLHRYLIDELLGKRPAATPKVHYVKSVEAAKRAARDHAGVALLMKTAPMEILREVSEKGGLMPHKSTYFYPKLATGLTIHSLRP